MSEVPQKLAVEQGPEDYAGAAISRQHSGPHLAAGYDRTCQGTVRI
jgi:hypothetical protein